MTLKIVIISTLWLLPWLVLEASSTNELGGWRYEGSCSSCVAKAENTNQLGYRGQKYKVRELDFIVLLVGDSQVQSDACLIDQMPEKVLQQTLTKRLGKNVRVHSIGANGYGQDQQLLALKQYFSQFSADLVVHWETITTNAWFNMFPNWGFDRSSSGVKPTFWIAQDGDIKGPVIFEYSELTGVSIRDDRDEILTLAEWEMRFLPPVHEHIRSIAEPYIDSWSPLYSPVENPVEGRTNILMQITPPTRRAEYAIRLTNQLILRMQGESWRHGAQFTAFSTARPDLPLRDGWYRHRQKDGDDIFVRLTKDQWSRSIRAINLGVDFHEIPIELTDFKVSEHDPHLNPDAVREQMIKLADMLVQKWNDH